MKHILLTTIAAVVLVGFLTGMATGALVALLMSVVTTENVMSAGWSALLTVIGTPLASAFIINCGAKIIINYGAKKLEFCEPRLIQLIPVAFLTLFIPVFGLLMGTPNKVDVLLMTLVGAVGGAFWSTPFVLWNIFRSVLLLRKHGGKTGAELKAEGK